MINQSYNYCEIHILLVKVGNNNLSMNTSYIIPMDHSTLYSFQQIYLQICNDIQYLTPIINCIFDWSYMICCSI
ncbi:hypothetical protein V1478_013741 [Vespula squamosa]|uniref:Uncharacterized protein n=1 Tax=Vespula squamosa TaxID=30214 RepID=A0ABD2A8F0_VESSQ